MREGDQHYLETEPYVQNNALYREFRKEMELK